MSFDTELFISEIEKRPGLYNVKIPEYTNKVTKKRLWTELSEIFIENWNDLKPMEQEVKGKELQSKWRNLRTTFRREYNKYKSSSTGVKKKRKYIYFDQLLFLCDSIEARETSNNVTLETDEVEKSEVFKTEPSFVTPPASVTPPTSLTPPATLTQPAPLASSEALAPSASLTSSASFTPSTSLTASDSLTPSASSYIIRACQQQSTSSYEDSLLNLLREKEDKEKEIDEDRYFLLSLLPAFRRFSDDQKFLARTEILKVMRKAQLSGNVQMKNQQISAASTCNNLDNYVENLAPEYD